MVVAKCQLYGVKPFSKETVFDIEFVPYEIRDGYCQLQLQVTRREGFDHYTIDWGDGTIQQRNDYRAFHNYTKAGKFTVRIGYEVRWWRLDSCYTVEADNTVLISRPRITPKCWSDYLESCEGTYCGWSNSDHGGVVGRIIDWGRSITSTYCCYQFCFDVTGGFAPWTDMITDACGTYDRCTGLAGRIPKWGKNIERVSQCFCDCPGVHGSFIKWPGRCVEFNSCFKNATGMYGSIPEWPNTATQLSAVYEGCIGAIGIIPPWPDGVRSLSRCYFGCSGLTGAWTDDPVLLMPEEKLQDGWMNRSYEVVTGCADSLRSLFWDKEWGGLIPRPADGGEANEN